MKTIDEILRIRRNRYHLDCLLKVRSIVPFIGAGMSSDVYPMWSDFLEQFDLLPQERVIVKQFLNDGEFEAAASYIFSISKRLFIDTVKDVFSPSLLDSVSFSPALKVLPRVTDDMIVTTNLDEVLERVWQHGKQPFDAIITPDYEDQFNDAITSNRQILIKLHGTVKESTKYVLTKEQYDLFYGIDSNNNIDFSKPFPRNLGRVLHSRTVLFLGCSLKGDRVLHILRQIVGWNEYVKHYAILSLEDTEEKNIKRERQLERYGIFPIWIPSGEFSCIATILNELLKKKSVKE